MSTFLDCNDQIVDGQQCGRKRSTYGGFVSIEFARDVEIQTPKYLTIQENVAQYLHNSWNKIGSPLLQDWGLPICVLNTGAHDVMIPNMTIEIFLKHLSWYMNIFKSECAHFIWLSNTAPASDATDFVQTSDLMKQYDDAVKAMIANSRSLRRLTSFVNVFDSSAKGAHADHIHMDNMWYKALGQ
jgi:hypothetical protein